MSKHLFRDLDSLRKEILTVGSMVEEATEKALFALVERRADVAEEVERGDVEVDRKEVQVEEECLKVLALHQPVAADLRFVIAVLKVNNDLERVGDLATNIAARAVSLSQKEPLAVPDEILEMASRVRTMLRDSLNALVELDTKLARKVLDDDDEVDDRHKRIYSILQERMQQDPARVDALIQILSVSRYLERMADQATNIAEDVVFMAEGEVIRHTHG
jgi:phosphate transport system protein